MASYEAEGGAGKQLGERGGPLLAPRRLRLCAWQILRDGSVIDIYEASGDQYTGVSRASAPFFALFRSRSASALLRAAARCCALLCAAV